ncbi:unnamed protein product [Dimorphilus gyrociliatus]|uniref:RING-type domain-containing protein n=1 Tax=Dimorphilus gyrociliatus TaxID=2664684 RepID=A0A7I8VF83_9ANNE|nr:unnamed protein product [Dimorphilus gyrociliatus]
MATSSFVINEKDIKCNICTKSWIDKDPKQLECQHVFCYKCLAKTLEDNVRLTCKTCKRVTEATLGISTLPSCKFSQLFKTKKDVPTCVIHPAIVPPFYCEYCKATNLCVECMRKHTSDPNCRVAPMADLQMLVRMIEEERENQEKQETAIKGIMQQEKEKCIKMLNNKFDEILSKVTDIFENRQKDLKLLLRKENYFMSGEDLQHRLKELCGRTIKPNIQPNITLDYELFNDHDCIVEKNIDDMKLDYIKTIHTDRDCRYWMDNAFYICLSTEK